MLDRPDARLVLHSRNRLVFVHAVGPRRFLGRPGDHDRREVTVEELETLASAGFDLVEIGMTAGRPLCAAFVSPRARPPQRPARRPARFDLVL